MTCGARPLMMSRARFDQSACERIAECVHEIENRTGAELVIVVRARSGSYLHANYLCGALLAFAGLLFLLFTPFEFSHYWVGVDVALLFALGAYLCSRSNTLRRLLTTREQRAEQVRLYAAAAFYELGVANTESEMGVLVYLSIMERRLEVVADRGVLSAAPALEWNKRLFDLHRAGQRSEPQALIDALHDLGALLAKCLPPVGENPDELPNAPRFDLR